MIGALHIEQVFLSCHSQLIQGIGLAEILNVNSFALLSTSTMIDVNDKHARYCIQAFVCLLYLKLKKIASNQKDG